MGLFRPFIPKSVNLGDQVQTALAQQKREPWPYIYVMYIYGCNAILTTAMNNIIDKEMIQEFTELTEDLKIRRINPGFHFMDNETYTTFKMIMTFMNIKYQLVPPNNHKAKNTQRSIQTFKNHFIAGLCSDTKTFIFNCGTDYYRRIQYV